MFRDEYSSAELWQMGVLLLGMPLAAVLGAMLGLVGKWRKGRVVTAALIGMGCASFVSCTLFLCFVFISTFANNTRRRVLLDLFDAELGEQLTRNAMIATGAISLLAAIGLRLRYRDEATGAAAVSMRQLLLLQVFTVVVLGCWTGMRFIAIERVSYLERASRKWTKREWGVEGDRDGNPASLRFASFGPTADYRAFNQSLALAAEEPWLKGLELNWVTRPEQLALSELSSSRSLTSLDLLILGQPAIVQQNVDDLGQITSLEFLHISCGDLFKVDLAPIAKLPRLKSVQLSGVLIDGPAFNGLAESSSLGGISLEYVQFTGSEPIKLPVGLIDLVIHATMPVVLDGESLAKMQQLKRIQLHQSPLTSGDLAVLARATSVETLQLSSLQADVDLSLLKACRNLRLMTLAFAPGEDATQRASIRGHLLELAQIPSLRIVHCPSRVLFEDSIPGVDVREIDFAVLGESDPIAKQRKEIELDVLKRVDEFQAQVDAVRKSAGLESLKFEFDRFVPMPRSQATPPVGGQGSAVGS